MFQLNLRSIIVVLIKICWGISIYEKLSFYIKSFLFRFIINYKRRLKYIKNYIHLSRKILKQLSFIIKNKTYNNIYVDM